MLNRVEAPELNQIDGIVLVRPEEIIFKNGLKVFVFRSDEQELIKAEFVFNNLFEKNENPIRNTALSTLLKEGTNKRSSADIAETIDYYGAYLIPEFSFDQNALTFYTLKKHVNAILPVVHDVLTDSIIPQKELDTYIRNNKQNLQITLEKNDVLARRMFYNNLFGANRYGISTTSDLLSQLNREDLIELYNKQIQPQNATLFLSGNITPDVLDAFRNYFENQWDAKDLHINSPFIAQPQFTNELTVLERENALQSSIRLGKASIQRNHSDYPYLQFVNTLLGGYFGSRLMSNIREEKGYTYSINSMVANLNHAGFITLITDVGAEHTKDTLKQIELEINKLQQEKTSDTEIELVRNYLLGGMLGSLESIFSHTDKFKSVYFSGLDLDYYKYYSDVVKNINAEHILDIAQKYLGYEDMLKIVVGKG